MLDLPDLYCVSELPLLIFTHTKERSPVTTCRAASHSQLPVMKHRFYYYTLCIRPCRPNIACQRGSYILKLPWKTFPVCLKCVRMGLVAGAAYTHMDQRDRKSKHAEIKPSLYHLLAAVQRSNEHEWTLLCHWPWEVLEKKGVCVLSCKEEVGDSCSGELRLLGLSCLIEPVWTPPGNVSTAGAALADSRLWNFNHPSNKAAQDTHIQAWTHTLSETCTHTALLLWIPTLRDTKWRNFHQVFLSLLFYL